MVVPFPANKAINGKVGFDQFRGFGGFCRVGPRPSPMDSMYQRMMEMEGQKRKEISPFASDC